MRSQKDGGVRVLRPGGRGLGANPLSVSNEGGEGASRHLLRARAKLGLGIRASPTCVFWVERPEDNLRTPFSGGQAQPILRGPFLPAHIFGAEKHKSSFHKSFLSSSGELQDEDKLIKTPGSERSESTNLYLYQVRRARVLHRRHIDRCLSV